MPDKDFFTRHPRKTATFVHCISDLQRIGRKRQTHWVHFGLLSLSLSLSFSFCPTVCLLSFFIISFLLYYLLPSRLVMLVAFAIIISPLSLYFSFPFRAGQYFFCTVQFGAASMMFVVGLLGVAPIQYARSMLLLLLLARAKGSFPPPSSWQKKSSFNWQLAGRSSVCKFAFPANFGTTHLLACRQMSFLFQQLHQKQKKPSTGRERRLQSRNTQIHTHTADTQPF